MKAIKAMGEGTLMVDLRFAMRELPAMMRDFGSMSIRQFLDVWSPELRDSRLMLKVKEEKYVEPKKSRRTKTKGDGSSGKNQLSDPGD